jgi:hypothetical protein
MSQGIKTDTVEIMKSVEEVRLAQSGKSPVSI